MRTLTLNANVKYRFYALFSLLIFLLFLNYVLLIPIPGLVFIGVLVLTAFLGDRNEIISVCISCIPLYTAIKVHYVLFCCVVIFLFKYGKEVKLDFGVIPIFLIVIWEFLHCFSNEANLKMIITFPFVYLFFIVLFFSRDIKSIDYSFVVKNFAIMVFAVCCILTMRLMVKNDFNIDVAFIDMRRLGLTDKEVGGLIINPNSLGIQCVLAIGGLIQIRSIGEKKIRYICLMVLILILGALTGSRTYLACLLILGVYLLLVSKGGIKAKVKASVIGIFCVVVSVLLLYLIFPTALETFAHRFSVKDITSGRNSLFVVYAEYIFSSPKVFLWGLGSLSLGEKIDQLAIAVNVPHNGIQEICVAWGIPGLIFFAAMIFVMIRRSRQENSHQIGLNYLLLVILFAKIMVGQVITVPYTMLSFALIYLGLCQDFSTNRQTEQIKSK